MTVPLQPSERLIDEALDSLAQTHGADLARQLKPILLANLDRGRIHRAWDGRAASLHEYVGRVAQSFLSLQAYLHQLQVERATAAWEPLYVHMQTWAYNFFLRNNFTADESTRARAIECAHDAALHLLDAHFPYDTDFNAWAHVLVQNTCRKYIHKSLKKSAVPEEKQVELTEDLAAPDELQLEAQLYGHELSTGLEAALAQLSDARRSVIQMIYLEGLEPEEVSQKLGKSVGAVYSLQFHALRDLRKILTPNRDNLNE